MKLRLTIINGLWISLLLSAACSPVSDIGKKRFIYNLGDKEHKLVFALPKGRSEEKYRVGPGEAKEQFYYFGDGSVFYVARHITWPTVNKFRIEALDPKSQKGSSFSGRDNGGLFWKEVQLEEFKVGYAYVTEDKVGRFNNALSSVKIR